MHVAKKTFWKNQALNTGMLKIKIDNKALIYNHENETINPKFKNYKLKIS